METKVETFCRWLSMKADELLGWAIDISYKKEYGYKWDEINSLDTCIRDYVLPRLIQRRKHLEKDDNFGTLIIEEEKLTKKDILKIMDTIIDGFTEWKKEDTTGICN
jgi:hypothetical protein